MLKQTTVIVEQSVKVEDRIFVKSFYVTIDVKKFEKLAESNW